MEVIMSDNPYQSPQTGVSAPRGPSGVLTETMVFYLKGASPWLRFLGIIGFIGCGILVVIGIVMLIAMPSLAPEIGEAWSRIAGTSLGFLYIILGVVGFFPSRFIYKFGTKIRGFLRSNAEQELELAFKYNRSFWKFSGIVTIIYLAIIPAAIVIGVIAAIGFSPFE
jgi:hypothetical protein